MHACRNDILSFWKARTRCAAEREAEATQASLKEWNQKKGTSSSSYFCSNVPTCQHPNVVCKCAFRAILIERVVNRQGDSRTSCKSLEVTASRSLRVRHQLLNGTTQKMQSPDVLVSNPHWRERVGLFTMLLRSKTGWPSTSLFKGVSTDKGWAGLPCPSALATSTYVSPILRPAAAPAQPAPGSLRHRPG